MRGKYWIAGGALLAGLAVMGGAVGTHLLRDHWQLAERELQRFELGIRYQLYHALGMILVGLLMGSVNARLATAAGAAFLVGIVLFSGGLYSAALAEPTPLARPVPVGGMAMILGWLLLAAAALVRPSAPA